MYTNIKVKGHLAPEYTNIAKNYLNIIEKL